MLVDGGITLRDATAADSGAVTDLLRSQSLTTAGLDDWFERTFSIADAGGRVVGAAGIEVYGGVALLRSVVVDPEWRGRGLARKLVARAMQTARSAGALEVYLLTTTADRYFPRLGFSPAARDQVPEALGGSAELQGACPATATVMRRRVPDR